MAIAPWFFIVDKYTPELLGENLLFLAVCVLKPLSKIPIMFLEEETVLNKSAEEAHLKEKRQWNPFCNFYAQVSNRQIDSK